MTSGLAKGRETIFTNGYAVQWFTNIFKNTKIIIYKNIPNNRYIYLTEITLDYDADKFSVEQTAKEKITDIESL